MSDDHPITRRDLMSPAQLFWLSLAAGLFAGGITLLGMGFFQARTPTEAMHDLAGAGIAGGITFIVTAVVIWVLILMVRPSQVAHRIDAPVLLARDEMVAREMTEAERAAHIAKNGPAPKA